MQNSHSNDDTSDSPYLAAVSDTFYQNPKRFSRSFWFIISLVLVTFFVSAINVAHEYLYQLEMQEHYLHPQSISKI